MLNGANGVFTPTGGNAGSFSGTVVETSADGSSTLTGNLAGNLAQNGTLTETLTVTGGTGVYAAHTGTITGLGTGTNNVLAVNLSGTIFVNDNGESYNAADWNNQITGIASDSGGPGLQGVAVSLQDTTAGKYWDGTGFNSATPDFLQATLGSGNTWSLAVPSSTLTNGDAYLAQSQATDTSSLAATSLGFAGFTYDTTAPATPAAPTLDPGSDSGVQRDNIADVTTPTLDGAAEANSSVQITDNGVFLGQAVAGATGNWTFTVGGSGSEHARFVLAHSITVTATDAAGNVSAPSDPRALTIAAHPVVTGISPTFGSASGGTQVTITGTGLGNASEVDFGGPGNPVLAADFVSQSTTQIVLDTPAPLATGTTVDVQVVTPDDTSATVGRRQVHLRGSANRDRSQPDDRIAERQQPDHYHGHQPRRRQRGRFRPRQRRSPNRQQHGDPDRGYHSARRQQRTGGCASDYDGGTSPIDQPADQFTYTSTPTIASISPSAGSPNGFTSVTIYAANIDDAVGVSFGGVQVPPFDFNPDGTGDLIVTRARARWARRSMCR